MQLCQYSVWRDAVVAFSIKAFSGGFTSAFEFFRLQSSIIS